MTHLLRRTKVAGLLLGLLLWPCGVLLAQDFEIRLHRPAKAGNKERASAVVHVSQKWTVKAQDEVVRDDAAEFTVESELVVTILEVNAQGKPTRVSLALDNCTLTRDEVKSEIVPKGTVAVLSVKKEETVVEIAGQPAAPQVREAMKYVFWLEPSTATADELYGTNERKKPGDHWSGSAELIAREYQHRKMTVKKEDISSTFTLEKTVKMGGVECLQIAGEVNIKQFEASFLPGATIAKGSSQDRYVRKFPVDTAKWGTVESSIDETLAFTSKGKVGPDGPETTTEWIRSSTAKRTTSAID